MWIRATIWFLFILIEFLVGLKLDSYLKVDGQFPFYWRSVILLIGLVLLVLVMRIAKNTGAYLKKHGRDETDPRFFTRYLVSTGYYACMRHPMHLGLMFFPLAIALIAGSPGMILIAFVLMIMITLLVKFVEEPALYKQFGNDYRKYAKQVPFYSFSIRCIALLLSSIPK